MMGAALAFSRVVDRVSTGFGNLAAWAVLIACGVSAGNALLRYGASVSSNAWLELQWYLFAAVVMLGASYTLLRNEHVRVDIFYGAAGHRGRLWIDIFGFTVFALPAMALLLWMTWPFFLDSFTRGEHSPAPGGLLRWPVKLLLPLGFALMVAQVLSELVKRVAVLRGVEMGEGAFLEYRKPEQ